MSKDIFVICEKNNDKGYAKEILIDKLEKFIVKDMNRDKCYIELIDGNKIYFMTNYEWEIKHIGYRPYKCKCIEFSRKNYFNKRYERLEDEEFYDLIIDILCEINKDENWFKGER